MNNKITEAANAFARGPRHTTQGAFTAGATFALKEIEQLMEAAKDVVNNLEREDEPALLDNLRAALEKTDLFLTDKNLNDGKEKL